MTVDLAKLIERLEAATGPDRELDAEIFASINPHLIQTPHDEHCFVDDEKWIRASKDFAIVGHTFRTKPYTSSIDAAATLVPNDLPFQVGMNVHHRYWSASINTLDSNGFPTSLGLSIDASTPALALCIAALKARSLNSPGGA